MKYFEDIPSINYPYEGKMVGGSDVTISYIECMDIMIRFRLKNDVIMSPLSYYTYIWKDGDRPDKIADLYYDDPDFAWLVMMSASSFDWLYDFPLQNNIFEKYIVDRYGSISFAMSNTHHYEDGEGDVIDYTTYISSTDPLKKIVSIYDFEDSTNTSKRKIKLLSKKFIPEIVSEYSEMIKRINESRDTLKTQYISTG